MYKMGFHEPFGHFKHKLWPKERLGVKLPIWLPTIKSRESPPISLCEWPATYHWKALDESYNFYLDLISIEGLHAKLWASKVAGVLWESQMWEFRDFRDKMTFGCWSHGQAQCTIRGKVVASLKFGSCWVLWIRICPWLVLAPKVF